jgi:hypothetical protein
MGPVVERFRQSSGNIDPQIASFVIDTVLGYSAAEGRPRAAEGGLSAGGVPVDRT